jgi:glucose-1-phosphate thymidylyltransferase
MKAKGTKFTPGKVTEWLDCGNKDATVYTNQRILEFIKDTGIVSSTHKNVNSKIIEPCFIGENVQLIDSVVGPHVSIGRDSIIENSVIKNSIIQTNSKIKNAELSNSMVGNFSEFTGRSSDLSLGDYSTIK